MAGKAIKAAALALSVTLSVLLAYTFFPAETAFWLGALAPNPLSLAVVLPLVALWTVVLYASERLPSTGLVQILTLPLGIALWLSLPIILTVDAVVKTLPTVRFADAFFAFDPELNLGLWRIMLAEFALTVNLWRTRGPHDSAPKICFYAFLCLLLQAAALAILGALFGLARPTGDPNSWTDDVWYLGRWMKLGGAYTVASIFSFFNHLSPSYADPTTYQGLAALIATPALFTVAVFIIPCYTAVKLTDHLMIAEVRAKLEKRDGRRTRVRGQKIKLPMLKQIIQRGRNRRGESAARKTVMRRETIQVPPVGLPAPHQYFTAHDGNLARRAANERGLLALYSGKARWDPAGRGREFVAIPADLARRLLDGGTITSEERRSLSRWIQKGEIKVEGDGNGAFRARVSNEKLRRDLEGQLARINSLRATHMVEYHSGPTKYVEAVINSDNPAEAFRRLLSDARKAEEAGNIEAFKAMCSAIREIRELYWNVVKPRKRDEKEARRLVEMFEQMEQRSKAVPPFAVEEKQHGETGGGEQLDREGGETQLGEHSVPRPFDEFTANDEASAVEEANKRGLVAVCVGRREDGSHGIRYEFVALPKETAETLVLGGVVKPTNVIEFGVLERLRLLGGLREEGGCYRIQSENLKGILISQLWQLKWRFKEPREYVV